MSNEMRDWFVEITRVGGWLRVAVLDPETGREAVVHGPEKADADELAKLAMRRLGRPSKPPPQDGLVV